MGKRDEALRLLSVLGARSEDTINQAATGWQILELDGAGKGTGEGGGLLGCHGEVVARMAGA